MAITEHDLGPVRGDINDSVATFTQAGTRDNIASGDTGSTIFGKIKKYFADMTLSAFATIVNNATTTVANTVLDGRMGKLLMDEILALNRNKITEVNTYHSVNIVQTGHVKRLCISNSIGLKTTDILTYCTLPVDLRPSFNFFKWVLVSYGVRAYVEVLTTGEVRLSRVSENVPAGTWISVNETYN